MSNDVRGIDIRTMRLADLDEIMDIEPVAFGSHHWSHQSFVNELNNSTGNYFVGYEKQTRRLVGYSGFWLIGEEAHITTLAVHPDFRRLHVGERLLINDILHAQKVGANRITLEVRISNETAQQLYYKYGFKSLGIRRNYYQDNDEDALVLWTGNIHTNEFKRHLKERMDALGGFVTSQIGFKAGAQNKVVSSKNTAIDQNNDGHVIQWQSAQNAIYRGADEC
jgi:ribosomal-protein-alanine N-acetyltransferase